MRHCLRQRMCVGGQLAGGVSGGFDGVVMGVAHANHHFQPLAKLTHGLLLFAQRQRHTMDMLVDPFGIGADATHGLADLLGMRHPLLAGSLVIVAMAWVMNNLRQRGSYPRYWW